MNDISYKLYPKSPLTGESANFIIKLSNPQLHVPMDQANPDYQAYLKWLDKGNTPEPAEEPA